MGAMALGDALCTRGFRPIALLPSLYRVYTKLRTVHVRQWIADHTRPFFALSADKSTLEVVARTLLHEQAREGEADTGALTAQIEISKCFDRVCWNR
eukprot:9393591-Pyramimonas_sp.AAC.1